jgi:hypothetical protein
VATPDDVLGVVAAALELCALEQPLDDLVLVDYHGDRCIETVTGKGDHPVELLDLGQRARVAVE